MPELPEVEIVRQSLNKKIKQKKVKKVIVRNRNLRFKIPLNFSNYFENKKITFKSAVLYKKEKSNFKSDYIVHSLKDNPWIVFPYELRELISIDQLKKELKKKG